MKNLKWLSLSVALVASISIVTHSAYADGIDKKNRLCRHLKMIYLLNGQSNSPAATEIKERYDAMTCRDVSFNEKGKDHKLGGAKDTKTTTTTTTTTVTAVTKDSPSQPTTAGTATAQ